MEYVHPFGNHWKERNLFQDYYIEMVKAAEEGDIPYFEQLRDELLEMEMGMEKYTYIWRHMSSLTRRKVKDG